MVAININKGTATIFHESGKPYTSISNNVVESVKNPDALAIWVFLQSKSNNWTVIGSFLQKHFSIGRARYAKAMLCLKDMGLIEYSLSRDEDGKISGNKITVRYDLPSSTETDMSVKPASRQDSKSVNRQLPIKDSITHEGSSTQSPSVELKPDHAEMVIKYLNKKAGKNYRLVDAHKKLINARIKEGATGSDFKSVIDRKCAEWLDDPANHQYLRPATLFNAEKFNNYLGQLDSPLPAKRSSGSAGAPDIDFESRGWMS